MNTINARWPCSRKALSEFEEFRRWFVFGEHLDGRVDINDGNRDIVTAVDPEQAERIIAARDAFLDAVEEVLCKP